MRELATRDSLLGLMRALGREADTESRVYFTGGASAVLLGWRETTIDADIRVIPESDRLFRAIPELKERLRVNIELASPPDFIPEVPGWRERSLFISREGPLSFHHFDFYSQALAKIERGHAQDQSDVGQMLGRGLVDPRRLIECYEQIEPNLYRYPALDPAAFRRAVLATVGRGGSGG